MGRCDGCSALQLGAFRARELASQFEAFWSGLAPGAVIQRSSIASTIVSEDRNSGPPSDSKHPVSTQSTVVLRFNDLLRDRRLFLYVSPVRR